MDNISNPSKSKSRFSFAKKIKPHKIKKPESFMAKSILIFIVFLAIEIFLFICLHFVNDLSRYFNGVVDFFNKVEQFILQYMDLRNILLVLLIIFFIYFIKSYLPFLPLSIVCIMTGIVFNKYWWAAVILNLLGCALMFYLRFNSGRVKGENYMQNLLRRSKYVRMAIDVNGASSYGLLAAFRFFPCFPLNFVSRLYGANKDCKFYLYMIVSTVSIAPRIYVYTRIGRELFNPFTAKFITLLMLFVAFGGFGAFIINLVFYFKRKNDEKNQQQIMEKMRYQFENEIEEESDLLD